MTDKKHPLEGAEIHFLRSITVYLGQRQSRVFDRGETLTLTAEILEFSRDRLGQSWFETELAKGSASLKIARGAWPEGVPTWIAGDAAWATAREQARLEAWAHPTLEEQLAARAEVNRVYGPAVTSRTLGQVVR
ncbi:hypothetical protein [Arenivirga flava]|uniref:Uncharacterized protein n=1 Tax=Arenivirga flava TaxID=1930060 RepID=A0AA37XAL8_9MICO|nr:hypothetical protein [Arenivirga flava]GMA26792.1 hypothetical protein GCM10025874_00450 [Arenivirga flava]GMA29907.1 hypothetical protein GCM10025874_31600 [Arenivirga flava]GMA29964.1 hypothetical protein GCM10025874_32170 [Arenivirga flava]